MINLKFADFYFEIKFHDSGEILLDELFKDKGYQKTKFYKQLKQKKYNLELPPDFNKYKNKIVKFLKNWDLESLKKFIPKKGIYSYDDFFVDLVNTFKKKIDQLQTLKTEKGENLITKSILPYNSDTEWTGFLYYQDKYDIIITNTLIVYDNFLEPYPHTIYKHAKTGGGVFLSPKRKSIEARSIMISIIETHGNVPGISEINTKVSKEFKNRAIGGYLLAHEFTHVFFLIPDVYDHGNTCLMNTTLENLEYLEGYKMLIGNLSPCQKCKPWVISKKSVIQAGIAYEKGDYNTSAEFYLKAAKELPKFISGDYKEYMKKLYEEALSAYKKVNNREGVSKCKKLIKNLIRQKKQH